jgi:CHAD domain-containing protein
MGDELELKYTVDDLEAVIAFLDEQLPPAIGYGWRTLFVTDTYFDTESRALAKAGYGARLRRHGRKGIVGLKSDLRSDGALVARNEIEAEATAALDPAAWPRSEARDIVRSLARRELLRPRFVLRQRKRRRDFGGLELSVDEVIVRRRREVAGELKELEVEYKSGRKSELTRVAKLIERSGLATPEPRSKMVLAAAMVEGAPAVYPGDALAESGRKVLGRLLERLVERDQAMRGGDTVALKQMRVTTRRMRAAWRSFAPAYRRGDVSRYVAELRGVARRLGEVRDLDVLLENLPADGELDLLRADWRARRAQAWQALLDVVDSDEYRTFLADYRDFVETPGAAATGFGRSTRVADAAASLVWAAYERVRAAQPPLRGRADPAQLHQVRIAARQFRYTVEAYRDLLDPRATPVLMERLIRLQDLIGELNDADVAAHETNAWLATHPDAPPAVAAYWAELEQVVDRLSRSVAPAARGVVGITFRRLLGRAVATL